MSSPLPAAGQAAVTTEASRRRFWSAALSAAILPRASSALPVPTFSEPSRDTNENTLAAIGLSSSFLPVVHTSSTALVASGEPILRSESSTAFCATDRARIDEVRRMGSRPRAVSAGTTDGS
jgi:hypothetical protein